ncbi:MAG: response regulator [Prolixibacteraceae bacterium]|nr:response regulator [Prolixibacteraceae bacterium]MBT6766944.1 response regulator [Prolixibacteraceae bacterium]MBT7396686.1 response regulator [Prolixibacteraceae bacterium]
MLKHFLTVEEGLSHNEVTSIVQDKDGFIWIGTRGGLNRYDGYGFKVFNQIPGDSNSLVNPSIEKLFIDKKGNIWIGTKSGGVSKYNPLTGVFKNIEINYKKTSEILPDNRILSFHEDQKGRIWFGTWEGGLSIYDEENNTSQKILDITLINTITETSSGKIWVGANSGLYEYIEEENRFENQTDGSCQEIVYDDKRNVIWLVGGGDFGLRKFDLRNYKVRQYQINDSTSANAYHTYESILIDKQDRIWVGTWGTGFYLFNPETEKFNRYLIYPENRQTLNKDYDAVLDIFQDHDKNIWVGTNGGGVCVLTPKLKFNSVGFHPEPGKGLPNTRLMSVLEDRSGNLWLGTIGSGLFWSPDRENFYKVENQFVHESRFFTIKYIYQDIENNVWVGTNSGTFFIEFSNGVPQMVRLQSRFPIQNFGSQVVSFIDDENLLFLGTLSRGLFLIDKKNDYKFVKRLIKQNIESGDLRSDRISYLLKDSKERIWIGTYNGLHIFNNVDTTIQVAENFFNITGEFTGNIITCIAEDQKGNIWIGTPNGLNRLVTTGENNFEVDYFTEKDGLASNFIKGISYDLNGNIWMSTNAGISKFLAKENLFVNFDENDGVKGRNFTEASVCKNSKGEIFFGGNFGLTYFLPDKIKEKPPASKPVFTGLSILNRPIETAQKLGSKTILTKSITDTKEIELSFRQNNFEIEFSALDFQSMGGNKYKYFLENHDEKWNFIGHRHFINFNNLKPGEYLLKVKSSNSHNVWNENPAELIIRIKPPFWQTWYALVFYILAVVGIVSIIRWNAVKQVRLANSLEMEKMQHSQDQKLSELKFQFFTNISHEFRTPLTLILAPLKDLIEGRKKQQIPVEAQHKIQLIQKNSLRLMRLVNQLLDFRKVETGNEKLLARLNNIEEFVNEVCHPFSELAQINEIRFKIHASIKAKNIWFDQYKLEIVLNNLISNAFKFTKENGKIEVALYEEEDVVLLSVSDNGCGIAQTELKYIFDRFYRVDKGDGEGSSGIGLALVKRFVEMHKGTISVSSQPDIHTEFIISLPKGTSHLEENEMIRSTETTSNFVTTETMLPGFFPSREKIKDKASECILIVEDNREINEYLTSLLEPLYCVETAFDGMEGYNKVIERKPDLIISDVMMPKVDGFELCRRIKDNEETSTLPIILLTAKNANQFKLLGAQSGADEYISKPFDPNYLLQKIRSLLDIRAMLKKQFGKSVRLEPSDIEITSSEEIFIKKTISIIEENLQVSGFSSEVLASNLNMSNSSLYRKLKALTNSSTAEFIRSIRIKRAGQMLANKELTITEIAYDVGFNDVKHFRTVFQKYFGCSPSEYRDKL